MQPTFFSNHSTTDLLAVKVRIYFWIQRDILTFVKRENKLMKFLSAFQGQEKEKEEIFADFAIDRGSWQSPKWCDTIDTVPVFGAEPTNFTSNTIASNR